MTHTAFPLDTRSRTPFHGDKLLAKSERVPAFKLHVRLIITRPNGTVRTSVQPFYAAVTYVTNAYNTANVDAVEAIIRLGEGYERKLGGFTYRIEPVES